MPEKTAFQERIAKENTHIMPVSEVIDKVSAICRANKVRRLEEELQEIDTLRKIDIFDYESIHNEFLLEDIKKYGKQIY